MKGGITSWVVSPRREYLVVGLVACSLGAHYLWQPVDRLLWAAALLGAVPLLWRSLNDLWRRRITIDVFNLFAISVSFWSGELTSAAFIVLMITSADWLEWRTRTRTEDAVSSLLSLKPRTALRLDGDLMTEIPLDQVRVNDVVVAESGHYIPVDGVVVGGTALVNEALVTGESVPVHKGIGASVLMSTVVDSGALKVRTTRIGSESTIERMAALMRTAASNKSKPEKLADRFAGIFLPAIIALGALVYAVTRDARMTAALFLVACADDMAVAIPMAMTASLGWAAKRGVIIKGGVWLDVLSRARTIVLDKTGTLTYGSFRLERVLLEPGTDEREFWRLVGSAEKFSEHPIGRALVIHAVQLLGSVGDPDETDVIKGTGVRSRIGTTTVAIGDEHIIAGLPTDVGRQASALLTRVRQGASGTAVLVLVGDAVWGAVTLADVPRPEAAASIARLRQIGFRRIEMFTGDNDQVAQRIGSLLGISHVHARMMPAQKLAQLEVLPERPVIMVGDGINDAPALARADVGIAMGKGGTAIASEAADVIILTDDLSRVADIALLGRRTMSVIRWDVAIWAVSNLVGFALVLTGLVGPALAAFYNFATDFLPLMNSGRLFRSGDTMKA